MFANNWMACAGCTADIFESGVVRPQIARAVVAGIVIEGLARDRCAQIRREAIERGIHAHEAGVAAGLGHLEAEEKAARGRL
ncbi:MAG: hypothetical protein O3B37_11720, partial [Proteobacteria bacterium]|nr:hypothetical protein [Pseudomonadota bacterium]